MDEKQSIPSSEHLGGLLFLASLACIGPLLALIPSIWIHPQLQHHLTQPSFIYITIFSLSSCLLKQISFRSFLIGCLGLTLISLHLTYTDRMVSLLHFILCFALLGIWRKQELSYNILLTLLCLDLSLSFHAKVFFDENILPITPLNWEWQLSIQHQACLLILPFLAFLFRKIRPLPHKVS